MDKKDNELFWSASVSEVKKGYVESEDEIKCLICNETFIKGRIYQIESELYDAKKACEIHIKTKHSSVLNYLINMNSTFTGLSDVQKQLISLFTGGFTDKEIATELGITTSTIRNHRFKLREKEKQARLFLAIMELLSENTSKGINVMDKGVICDAHKTATTLDNRFNITSKEKSEVIKNYFNENGGLKTYPSKEKKKIIVLEEIMKSFKIGKKYTEKQINIILKRIYEDNVTIRRALIEYGFLDRTNDCSNYWVKE